MKRRILSICLALALCLSLLPGTALAAEDTPVYLALGDSITSGYGLTGTDNFANQVAEKLGYDDPVNVAVDGDTSGQLLEKLNDNEIDVSTADLITITIGGNDLMGALYEYLVATWNADSTHAENTMTVEEIQAMLTTPNISDLSNLNTLVSYLKDFPESEQAKAALDTFTTNLASIIGAIKTANPSATILVATQYNPYAYLAKELASTPIIADTAATISSAFEKGVTALNQIINSGAATAGYQVVDVHGAFQTAVESDMNPCNPSYTAPTPINLDFHPNQNGHDLIADTIVETLFEGLNLTVGGTKVTQDNFTDVLGGTDESGTVTYDPVTNTLTLTNATITGSAYGIKATGDLTIALVGESTVSGNASVGIDTSNGNLTITGPGSLKVTGSSFGIDVTLGGAERCDMTVTGGATVTATATHVESGYGIRVYSGDLFVSGGSTVTGTGQTYGIITMQGSMTVSGSTVTGICHQADRSYGISSSAVTLEENAVVRGVVESGEREGLHASPITGDGIAFSNNPESNTGTVYGSVTLQDDLEIDEGETLTIPAGASLTVPEGKKLTNNGTIDNSGTVTIEEGGSLTNDGSGTVNNSGTLTGSITGKQPPQITTPPAAQSVTEGSTASFTVQATGENLSYQWQQSTDGGTTWTDISGAAAASYTISNTTMVDMSGHQYRCVVSNSAGSVTSTAATLTVTSAPIYTITVQTDGNGTAFASHASALAETEITLTAQENEGYTFVRWEVTAGTVTIQENNTFIMPAENVTVKAIFELDSVSGGGTDPDEPGSGGGSGGGGGGSTTPTQTPSQQAADKIEDAQNGDTVAITLRTGQTELDKEVFEELSGKDVTLEVSLPGGVTWTVNGQDIPENADLSGIDMGVSMDTSTIPVNLINAVTGEMDAVQFTLAHDGAFGFTMTLTAPVGAENAGLWANLYYYDESAGKMVYQTSALVDEDGHAALPFDHASQYALVLDDKSHDLPFTDVAEGVWYEDAVGYVYRHDLMTGYSDNLFGPANNLTRAQLCQIVYNMEGQPAATGSSAFTDVADGAWYADAVTWAASQGVVDGYGGGLFGPEDNITREQLAAILYRYAQAKGYDVSIGEDTNILSYDDALDVSEWAIPAMQWAYGAGIVQGDGSSLNPQGEATRAQTAAMLMRFCQQLDP